MATYPPTASSSDGATDPSPEQPLTQLLSRMTGDLTTLFRKEVQLAKIEIRDDVKQTAKAGGIYGAAGFAGYLAAVLISFALAFLLDLIMATWLAFAIIGVLYAVAGYVLFRLGQHRFKEFNRVPQQTIETIKEDIEWARTRNK